MTPKRKRFRRSKFDPYITEIAKYAAMGMSVQEIADLISYHFDEFVDKEAVYAFMRSRGIQSRVTMGGTNLEFSAPKCDECSDCLTVLNTNKTEVRVCLPAKRMVSKSCYTSPMWCEKRGEVNEAKEKMDPRRI